MMWARKASRLCAEMIAAVRDLPDLAGVHLMPRIEKQTPELLRMAGIDRSALAGEGPGGEANDAH